MKRASKNFIFNLVYQLFILIMPLITSPYVSRIFGPSGVGTYSFYFSIATYFTYFELLGINNYGVRNIAKCTSKEERDTKFCEIFYAQLSISVVVIAVYMAFCAFSGGNFLITLCYLPYVISGAIDINWYFFGTEQFSKTTIRNILVKTIIIVLIFIVIKTNEDLYLYILIISFGYLISQLVMWAVALRQIRFKKIQYKVVLSHFKGLFLLFIPVLAVSLYRLMDKVMLGFMTNMEEVGYYESAEKIVGVPGAVTTALGISMLPMMTGIISSGDKDKTEKNISASIYFVGSIIFAMVCGIIGIANIFIPLYFGEEFSPSSNVLVLLSFSLLFSSFASVVRTQYLVPKEKDKIYVGSVICGAVVNIIANIFLIMFFGAIGAAIGTILAEFSVAIYQAIAIRKEMNIFKMLKPTLPFIPCAALMCGAIFLVNNFLTLKPWIIIVIDIAIGIVVYGLLAFPFIRYHIRRKKNEQTA